MPRAHAGLADLWPDVRYFFSPLEPIDLGETAALLRQQVEAFALREIAPHASECMVTIVGHTDSTGSDAINNPLSLARANSVRDYLVARGVAYQAADGSVYFSIEKYRAAGSRYGQLVNLNFEGMRRRGYSPELIAKLRNAYKVVYMRGLKVEEALAQLEADAATTPEVKLFTDSIRNATRGIDSPKIVRC
mgnify:CR=1 FL=1